jgi:phosphopantothenoylcysteine decarboxylase/phosphopantothenate--cysteine ligase
VRFLKERTGASVCIHPDDADWMRNAPRQAAMFGLAVPEPPPPDALLSEGDVIRLSDQEFRVLHTPGHSPGHVTFLVGGMAFVGDLIFAGSVGRTDLPGGSYAALLRSVREKIFTLPPETILLPGHGPATTVEQEKRSNPFFIGDPIAMTTLAGREIVLGVTGGIAAYKACEIGRELRKEGANVVGVLTAAGGHFTTPLTLQPLSKNPVHTDLFNLISESEIGHISLAQRANLLLVAPATANIIGKIRNGIADDLLSTIAMATTAPILLAPAMNSQMYASPAVRENVEVLSERGVTFVDPDEGELACGTTGPGRLADPGKILEMARILLADKILEGKKVVVSAGPTAEDIDPVRYLTNRASGKMGFAMAAVARRFGAEVTLVTGPTRLADPPFLKVEHVRTAKEMMNAVAAAAENADAVVMAAAVADFAPRPRPPGRSGKGRSRERSTWCDRRHPRHPRRVEAGAGARRLRGGDQRRGGQRPREDAEEEPRRDRGERRLPRRHRVRFRQQRSAGLFLRRDRPRHGQGPQGGHRHRRLAGGLPQIPQRMKRDASRRLLAAWLREVGVDYVPARAPAPGGIAAGGGPPAEELDASRRELEGCRGCGLCKGRSTIVFGTGNPRARLMFVGEGPGAEEDRQGEPFVGAAGKRLDQWIARIGLTRADVYIANIVKCRPPGNRVPTPDEAKACMGYLLRQIRAIRPEVVCTLGLTALNHLCGVDERITRARGRWRELDGIPLLPTYHPAFILRDPAREAEVFEDFREIGRRLSLPERG